MERAHPLKSHTAGLLYLWGLLLLLPVPAPLLARTPPPAPLEIALVIGNNHHKTDVRRGLSYADDDAIRVGQYFKVLHPAGELWLLLNPDFDTGVDRLTDLGMSWQTPTRAHFDEAIDQIRGRIRQARARGPQSVTLFFYFSGHGEEGATLHLEDDYLSAKERWKVLSGTGADQTFALLDGCYLGQDARGSQPAPDASLQALFAEEAELPLPSRPPGAGYIGATTTVPELNLLHGGLLTQVALNGLLGLADLDGDQRISFYEWGKYIRVELDAKPGAPRVMVIYPRQDPVATVVDLRTVGPVGLVLERDFPSGLVQVTRAGTRDLVVQLYHHRRKRDDLRLAPGRYDVVRFLEPGELIDGQTSAHYRVRRVYPAGSYGVDLELSRKAILNAQTVMRPAFVVPRSQRGGADVPESADLVTISEEEERVLTGPLSEAVQTSRFLPPPSWSWSLQLDNPWGGLKLGDASMDSSWFTPGGAIGATRIYPLAIKSRAYLGAGFALQYGVDLQRNLYGCRSATDTVCNYPTALRHRVRLGPVAYQLWMGSRARLSLEESFSWAPAAVTSGLELAHDIPHDQSSSPDRWRYLFLTDAIAALSAAVMFPVGRSLEVGPAVRVELELFDKFNPGGVSYQVSAGLELRQSAFR